MERTQYLVTALLPQAAQESLNHYRAALNPQGFKRIAAHITLTPPFSITTTLEEIKNLLDQFAERTLPLYAFIQGVDQNFPKKEIVVLKVSPGEPFEKMARELAHTLRPSMGNDGHIKTDTLLRRPFLPHITLGSKKEWNNNLAQEIAEQLTNRPLAINRIGLWRLEDAVWKLQQSFTLKK